MRLVYLESPFAGDQETNMRYAKACMLDCLRRGEAPFVSHLLYTQVLDDDDTTERWLGMTAGFEWATQAQASVVYTDRGISGGMKLGVQMAERAGRPVEYRTLQDWGSVP